MANNGPEEITIMDLAEIVPSSFVFLTNKKKALRPTLYRTHWHGSSCLFWENKVDISCVIHASRVFLITGWEKRAFGNTLPRA
jgi:hypothetical protein